MKKRPQKIIVAKKSFGFALGFGDLIGLATELQELRLAPPAVTTGKRTRTGDILGFVRGLRLSARLAYFLRDQISHTECEVSWGHLLDDNEASCSSECDIIIHKKGHHRRWNGNDRPIMDFRFVRAVYAKAVVSCKSMLTSVDAKYPKSLKKFGVKRVFLFAECCRDTHLPRLKKAARKAGYAGLCCLYVITTRKPGFTRDEKMYRSFSNGVLKAAVEGEKLRKKTKRR